jgi:hypothetical protein
MSHLPKLGLSHYWLETRDTFRLCLVWTGAWYKSKPGLYSRQPIWVWAIEQTIYSTKIKMEFHASIKISRINWDGSLLILWASHFQEIPEKIMVITGKKLVLPNAFTAISSLLLRLDDVGIVAWYQLTCLSLLEAYTLTHPHGIIHFLNRGWKEVTLSGKEKLI